MIHKKRNKKLTLLSLCVIADGVWNINIQVRRQSHKGAAEKDCNAF